MYGNKFAVAVKVGGRILREKEGVVYLPFGSEFELLLKNLNSQKVSVKVNIDGKDVLGGRSLIIDSNESLDLERFVDSYEKWPDRSYLDRGNRFKFIQKTKEIVEHRGDRIDDGIVRVEFAFEQVTKHVNVIEHHDYYDYHYGHHHHHNYPTWWPYYPPYYPYPTWTQGSSSEESYGLSKTYGTSGELVACSYHSSTPLQDEGITVKGSQSDQHFHEGYIGILDPSEVIIIRLRGEGSAGVKVESPITVHTYPMCPTCGTSGGVQDKFCAKCGTAIGII